MKVSLCECVFVSYIPKLIIVIIDVYCVTDAST